MVTLTLRRPMIMSGRGSCARRRRLGVVFRVFLLVSLVSAIVAPLPPIALLCPPARASATAAPATAPVAALPSGAAPDRVCAPPAFGLWRLWRWRDGVARTITAAKPCLLIVSNTRARPGPGALTIDFAMDNVAAGATATAEMALTDASGGVRTRAVPLRAQRGRASGTAVVPDFGGATVRVAITGRLSGGGAARCTIGVSFAPTPGPEPAVTGAPATATPEPTTPALSGRTATWSVPAEGEVVPRVDVVRVTRLTTARQAERTYHALWRWSFGDGTELTDPDPTRTTITQTHDYRAPGTYQVRAQSISNAGELLRELGWTATVPPATEQGGEPLAAQAFTAETIVEPTVSISVTGPHKWVAGRPAPYQVSVRVSAVPHCERVAVLIDPGREFDVVWERAGRYTVRVAAVVHLRYTFPERVITVVNTYVRTQEVEVFATVVSD